jgi:exonuclease SbcC
VATLTSQVAALNQELEAWASAPQPVYDQALSEKQVAFNYAEAATRRADEVQRTLETSRNAEERIRSAFESADADLRQAELAQEQSKAIVDERAVSVPPEFRDAARLAQAAAAAAQKAQQLKTALDIAQRQANEASQQASVARARVEFASTTAIERREHAEAARSRFDAALSSAGFRDETLYRAALRSRAQIAALDDDIRRYHGNLKAAEQRLTRARDQAEGAVQADLPNLEATVTRCQQDLEKALDHQRKIERDIEDANRWLGQLSAIAADLQIAEKRFGVVSTLAHAASGGNDKRITLQRFVQVTLLERVLDSATVRLQAMSNGRYWLRVAQDMENRRSAAGLDLDVLDAHSGQARRVSTLSGGESFLASLSLALGLSDVVQSCAGGYHLESIFVDEGFGALDPEALDLALSTLRSLQHGGRLVGIISHVPELKQQIDVRLDVIAQKRGSTAHFTVPGNGSLLEPVTTAH